jgi:hypothetical protein
MRDIIVHYRACDGYRTRRVFKTLKGARKYAHEMIGAHPDLGAAYAVSFDGIGVVEVDGTTLAELFPAKE